MPATVRPVLPTDIPAILRVHVAAFPTEGEARLVELIIQRQKAVVSLVAEVDRKIVGHILFSPVTFDASPEPLKLGLAPLAVLPAFHKQGIGSMLARTGLEACRRLGCPYVVVLGSPAFYSKFGFQPASRWNLASEYGGGDAFQFVALGELSLPARSDTTLVRYASEFNEVFGT